PMTGYYYLDFLIQCAIIGPVILILSLIFYLAAERPFMLIRPHGPVRSVDDVGAGPGNVGTGSDIMNAIKSGRFVLPVLEMFWTLTPTATSPTSFSLKESGKVYSLTPCNSICRGSPGNGVSGI